MPRAERCVPRFTHLTLRFSLVNYPLMNTPKESPKMGIPTSLKERNQNAEQLLQKPASNRLLFGKVNDWVRHHPGAQTAPSQVAFETISRTSHVSHS
jgi:hypothetical protein